MWFIKSRNLTFQLFHITHHRKCFQFVLSLLWYFCLLYDVFIYSLSNRPDSLPPCWHYHLHLTALIQTVSIQTGVAKNISLKRMKMKVFYGNGGTGKLKILTDLRYVSCFIPIHLYQLSPYRKTEMGRWWLERKTLVKCWSNVQMSLIVHLAFLLLESVMK